MLAVHKYPMPCEDHFVMTLPIGARLLSVQVQRGQPCLWAIVDPSAANETRRFRFAGTGHPITERAEVLVFVSTFQMEGGSLVFHVFEIIG